MVLLLQQSFDATVCSLKADDTLPCSLPGPRDAAGLEGGHAAIDGPAGERAGTVEGPSEVPTQTVKGSGCFGTGGAVLGAQCPGATCTEKA